MRDVQSQLEDAGVLPQMIYMLEEEECERYADNMPLPEGNYHFTFLDFWFYEKGRWHYDWYHLGETELRIHLVR